MAEECCKTGFEFCCSGEDKARYDKIHMLFKDKIEAMQELFKTKEEPSYLCLRLLMDMAVEGAQDRRYVKTIALESAQRFVKENLDRIIRSRVGNIESFATDELQLGEIQRLREDLERLPSTMTGL